jgi:ParB/RepB/Spo0J family partition protein
MKTKSKPRSPRSDDQASELLNLPLASIDAHPDNPRENWESQQIEPLARSIDEHGLVQPIIVRPHPTRSGRYQLVAGERRVRAAIVANRKTIPAIVRKLSDGDALGAMLAENLQRKNLNPLEIARLLHKLCTPIAEGGAGYRQARVARIVGKSRSHVSNLLRLLRLPDAWKRKLAAGEIKLKSAIAIVGYVDRPEVLSAVERDMAAKPWAWKSARDFDRNLAIVAADTKIAAVLAAGPKGRPSASAPAPIADRRRGRPRMTIVARQASAVDRAEYDEEIHLIVDNVAARIEGWPRAAVAKLQHELQKVFRQNSQPAAKQPSHNGHGKPNGRQPTSNSRALVTTGK